MILPRTLLRFACLLAAFPMGLAAQSMSGGVAPAHASWGLGLALESLSNGVDPLPQCQREAERSLGYVVDAHVQVPVWRAVSLEGRGSLHKRARCLLESESPTSVSTWSSNVEPGSFAAIDLRLLLTDRRGLTLGIGGGWAASAKQLPFVLGSAGIRRGARVRWGVDVEMSAHRVPWTVHVMEIQGGTFSEYLLPRQSWKVSYGVRLAMEIPFRLLS